MRVSLAGGKRKVARAPLPLLDSRGARVVLGAQPGAPVAPLLPSAASLFGPRGACLAAPDGPLFVCDTGHHRLLIWSRAPRADGAPADVVIGQPDFISEGRGMLNVPTGVAFADSVLAVADAWNHRVLLWHGVPQTSNQPPDLVLAGDLFWPYGVALHEGRLLVADTGNRRVLAWDEVPRTNRSADHVVREGMRWPHALAFPGGDLFVADAGEVGEELNMPYGATVLGALLVVADTANSRLLGFEPAGAKARFLAGQASFDDKGENRWQAASRDSLCWPYGVSACGTTLVVADTGNNRVLLWDLA